VRRREKREKRERGAHTGWCEEIKKKSKRG